MVIATEERTAIDVAGLDIGQAVNYPPAPWIPGTEHRADCAVGQLRPERMMPCSTEINPWIEPWPQRNLLNDRLQLCRQHQAPDYNVIPPWISGTSYRADCAVGQLRPTGMMPCSDEPLPRANDQDGARLCRQHSYPTWQRCIILAEVLFGQDDAPRSHGPGRLLGNGKPDSTAMPAPGSSAGPANTGGRRSMGAPPTWCWPGTRWSGWTRISIPLKRGRCSPPISEPFHGRQGSA